MNGAIPVVVRMCVECTICGHAEDDTYEFDMPNDEGQPGEERVPGKCPDCGAAVGIYLKQTQQAQ